MSIRLTFACGHALTVGDSLDTAPACVECGERRVSRVKAPAPRFVGACQGPLATPKGLGGLAINAAPGGSLGLKDTNG